jgi:hypothetical protein
VGVASTEGTFELLGSADPLGMAESRSDGVGVLAVADAVGEART